MKKMMITFSILLDTAISRQLIGSSIPFPQLRTTCTTISCYPIQCCGHSQKLWVRKLHVPYLQCSRAIGRLRRRRLFIVVAILGSSRDTTFPIGSCAPWRQLSELLRRAAAELMLRGSGKRFGRGFEEDKGRHRSLLALASATSASAQLSQFVSGFVRD